MSDDLPTIRCADCGSEVNGTVGMYKCDCEDKSAPVRSTEEPGPTWEVDAWEWDEVHRNR